MDKRGTALDKLSFLYLVIIVVVLVTLLGRVSAAKDDTGYELRFYSLDIAYSIEGILWIDEDVDEVYFVYALEEGYVAGLKGYYSAEELKGKKDKLVVKKGLSVEEKKFRTRAGYDVEMNKLPADENLYLFKRVKK